MNEEKAWEDICKYRAVSVIILLGDCSITFPELRKYCLQWKVWKTQFTTHDEISRLAESSKALEMRRSVTRWRQQLALLREETPVALILIFKLCCIRSRCIYCYIFISLRLFNPLITASNDHLVVYGNDFQFVWLTEQFPLVCNVDENRLSKFYTTFWNRKDCQVSWNSCFPFARLSVQKMDCHSWMLGLYDYSFYHICLLHFKLYFVRQQANILIPIDQF